ncbi:hypothetical protein QN277_011720 [Acacia crassicarpa]|uniref:Uncharacterized protein n=1 Tax=Acacia crassicarpa TaxID=499986 RepID=A0AAE1MZA2_9FABA|nr:hypothetical protein QN277_011720 [Acacia crassicarpa]
MASFSYSSSSSIFIDSSSKVIITDEDFKNFHGIDRKLFLRLVSDIVHEPRRATLFMALFLWFEKTAKDFTLISKLLQWPHALLTDLTNEAALVYTCIDSSDCLTKNNVNLKYFDLPLTQKITNSGISLHFIHRNRIGIKQAIVELMKNVCDRAFDDIVVQYLLQKKAQREQNLMKQGGVYCNVSAGFEVAVLPLPPQNVMVPPLAPPLQGRGGAFDVMVLNNEVWERKDVIVTADDRTIFLTFSKGYPISDTEIREFFFRRYGDVIEGVLMQEVASVEEQPLYARMVLRPEFIHMMEVILEGPARKSKFCINGKHLWARKYVRKTTKLLSPAISPATSLPNIPRESIRFLN